MPENETSSATVELLLDVDREARGTLGSQIEDQLRCAIRDASLRPGSQLPSTRDLAGQLGVSRRITVDAYAQLAAEGYLELRQGARPRVAEGAGATAAEPAPSTDPEVPARYDLRPGSPDVSLFPRTAWWRAMREVMNTATDADLGYGDPRGADSLRLALAEYLGRVRGAVAAPEQVIVTSGYTQGLNVAVEALAAHGVERVAFEDPGQRDLYPLVERFGLEAVPVPVDREGLRVDALEDTGARAVLVTPAHQHPTGALMSGARRKALRKWLHTRDAYAIEDEYDAEYRFDRAAVGSLQGLEPDRVIYAGTVSKTLVPALRLGWLLMPAHLTDAARTAKLLADHGNSFVDQMAFAVFLTRGDLDRHLRRMRARYRRNRDAVLEVLGDRLPEARVPGIAAGLHAVVELPATYREDAVLASLAEHGVRVSPMSKYGSYEADGPVLCAGFARYPEPVLRHAFAELAAAVRASR